MKKILKLILLLSIPFIFLSIIACSQSESNNYAKLDALEFQKTLEKQPEAIILDVRTPEEFEQGHLQGAINVNWNGNDFEDQVTKFSKDKPVFVYCLSGGRSSAAANYLNNNNYKHIYELKGGMMNWRTNRLPEVKGNNISEVKQLTKQELENLLQQNDKVLVDFYADWCIPCQKMKPYLEEIEKNATLKTKVIRINVDQQKELCQSLKITSIPELWVYKNGQKTWSHQGMVSKEELLGLLK